MSAVTRPYPPSASTDEFPTPVCRPSLPPAVKILPYLSRVDEARHYTNHGQLSEELTGRLCSSVGIERERGVLAASGTAGLTGAILAAAGRAAPSRPLCI